MRVRAHTYLTSLVGRRLVLEGILVTVTAVRETSAVVAVQEAPMAADEHVEVPIEWVQNGVDWLYAGREVPRPADADGLPARIAFLLLQLFPEAERIPGGIVLTDPQTWDLQPGESITTEELQTRFDGRGNTRISVSRTSENVFLVAGAAKDKTTQWQENVLHIQGNKIHRSDLSEGSSAVLEHLDDGLALRVFWRHEGALVYAGEFTIAPFPTHYISETRGSDGHLHKRIVFRLAPVGAFVRDPEGGVEGADAGSEATTPFVSAPTPVVAADTGTRPRRELNVGPSLAAAGGAAAGWLTRAGAWVRAAARDPIPVLLERGPWPPALLASTLAVSLTTWVWTSSPLRAAVTTWFLLVCPGMALVRLLPWRGTLLRLVLAVAASLTVATLLAETAVLAHLWSPSAVLLLLMLITVSAVALDLADEPVAEIGMTSRLHVLPAAASEGGGRR